jgi:diacylglycerol O-acyltransferase / wax synthase
MFQLGALDNLMVDGEMAFLPMHMSALMIYETGGKRRSRKLYAAIENGITEVIEQHFPILRCRLESVPLQLDKSYWVEDEFFSPSYHISRTALPKGQDWQELYQMFGQFHARPLDQSRPLWEVVYVEGLDNLEGVPRGSTAMFMKIHHGVMDGKGAQRLMSSFHSLNPEPGAPRIAASFPAVNPEDEDFRPPGMLSKYGRAWWHSIERPIDLVATLTKLIPGMLQGNQDEKKTKKTEIPKALFNQPVGADRVVGHVRMGLKQLKKIEDNYGCTINDIALTVVAGAIRDYLLQRDELPDADLQSLMPMSIRQKDEDGKIGNHVTVAKLPLYTALSSAKERLQAIHADSQEQKKRIKKSGPSPAMNLVDDIHPAIIFFLGKWLVTSGHLEDLPNTVNTAVTNVPGIPHDAYLNGIKLIDYLGFGPLAPNMGLFHTVSSTEDHVNISFLTTSEILGDGSEYRIALEKSWEKVRRLGHKR